ncbi:Sec-independent protein translocase protein TatA [Collinsella sp. AK_207A]|uniref:twin-arginine translocase TatA/TatE family subunit n=1 Tax=Collinsella sp. AK_207A TaxID=2650472 RepID=UPI001260EBA4|nr:twin-arginine translocase TatA/TatE family subunit [Collinsella sp. AK_207A]VWM02961.1 Sec-independent protein translocase protein TatA [Collinsella sp. AK_207A]
MFPKGMEWIVILIIALLIFGPKNLPKLGKSLGSTVKNIREGMSGDDDAASKDAEETVIEAGEDADDDAEIHELEAKLAAAKKKKEEDSNPVESH